MRRGVRILVLGNGAAGAEKQALALSERLRTHLRRARALPGSGANVKERDDDTVELIRVPFLDGAVYQKLPPTLQLLAARMLRDPFFGYDVSNEQRRALLGEDATDSRKRVVIGCGRTTVSLCAALKQPWASESTNSVFNIQIQHPRVPLRLFDAVISPRHDFVSSAMAKPLANVHLTLGTVCAIDLNALEQKSKEWQSAFEPYVNSNEMRVAWLIGGPCRGFPFSESNAEEMVEQVLRLVLQNRQRASLLVTFSRRTPAKVRKLIGERLRIELQGRDELYIWSGEGPNPFEAMLHYATAIVTTPDSISMTTEAIATGKPVLTVCADRISGKFKRFHEELFKSGYTTALTSQYDAEVLSKQSPSPNGRDAVEAELERISARLASEILSE